jgi:hypothetical protein
MRWTRKHISIGMLAVAAAILAVAAMNPVDTTPDTSGPIGSGLSIDPPGDNSATDDPPAPETRRPVITLGDLDPPPDPCTVIGWTDLPGEIRPVTDTGPNTTRTHVGDRTGVQRIDTHQHDRPLCIGLTHAVGAVAGSEATTTRTSIKDARAAVAAALFTIAPTIRQHTKGHNETMHHRHLGDDPHWASHRLRERLQFTDPPVAAPPRPHHLGVLRGVHAVIAAVAIIAALGADTTPASPTTPTTKPGAYNGIDAPLTRSAPGHRVDTTGPPTGRVHHHSTLPHHTKEALR